MRVLLTLLITILLQAQDSEVRSRVCGGCHPEIFRSYIQTGMARSSGRAGSGSFAEKLPAGPIADKSSGATYRITPGEHSYEMEFKRPHAAVSGVRELKWFIGSGNVGRSYAFAVDGFLFQAPVSYYSSVGAWDLSPGYAGKPYIDLAKPIEEPCLYCHASGSQRLAKTQNRYPDPPFRESGIGCERCHGPGQKHVQTHREIVNPVKLEPARRDSICQQCHLTGAARVPRPGRGVGTFRPGDSLSDHLTVFVWDGASGKAAATDHSEQLAMSKCKLASGDRMWCGTCHDPHATPNGSDRVGFYQKACLRCHSQKGCTLDEQARRAKGNDCASCHMPKNASREGEHVAYTDHRILRRPVAPSDDQRGFTLRSFWGRPAEDRDVAIAYASLGRARLPLLEKLRSSDDAPVLVQLAQLYDAAGKADSAENIYERVLRLDPLNAAAEANLAIYRVRNGRSSEAIALWQDVFSRYPALAGAGINLAVAQLDAGDRPAALKTVGKLLQFHPDLEAVRQLQARLR